MEVQALQNRPTLNQWVTQYWEAFQILSGSRAVYQGSVGPIPVSEIVAYLEVAYITNVDERLRYITMIQGLDHVYVSFVNERAKQQSESQRKLAKHSRKR